MIKNLNICIDIDGTVTEPFFWLPDANRFFDKQVEPKDITSYEIYKAMGTDPSAYDEFYGKLGESMHRRSGIRPGVKEVIGKLSGVHQVHFVTAREEIMRDVSLEWLQKHRIPFDTISLLGSHHKASRAKSLHCDLFIEDSRSNALELSRAGFDVLLVDCTYNQGRLPANITRVSNWNQIEKMIQNYKKPNIIKPAV
ncbi:MAG: 5' nucleotidase, NT5C type [Christensenellales bacterium]